MSFGDTAENDLLKLIFQAVDWGNIADDTVTSPETSLGVALHTTTPGEAGDQTTNEAGYTSYAREDIVRTAGGWSVTTNVVNPAANIDFTEATGGGETEDFFSIGKASGDYMLLFGTVTPGIVVSSGVTPRLTTATSITLD